MIKTLLENFSPDTSDLALNIGLTLSIKKKYIHIWN